MNYKLEIDQRQAQVISDALEFFSRMAMGQFTELVNAYQFEWKCGPDAKLVAERMLLNAKMLLTDVPPGHAYKSIGSPDLPDTFKVAYDIHQVIRHRLAWDHDPKPNIMNCHKDEPMRFGKSDLPGISKE